MIHQIKWGFQRLLKNSGTNMEFAIAENASCLEVSGFSTFVVPKPEQESRLEGHSEVRTSGALSHWSQWISITARKCYLQKPVSAVAAFIFSWLRFPSNYPLIQRSVDSADVICALSELGSFGGGGWLGSRRLVWIIRRGTLAVTTDFLIKFLPNSTGMKS